MNIKMYEDFGSEKYYKHITPEYASEIIGPSSYTGLEKGVNFTEREINRIKSVYSDIKKPSNRYYVEFRKSSGMWYADEVTKEKQECVFSIILYHNTSWMPRLLSPLQTSRVGLTNSKREKLEYQNIYKIEDDWFVLKHSRGGHTVSFKCDQMDGLIKCMEDYKMKFPPKFII